VKKITKTTITLILLVCMLLGMVQLAMASAGTFRTTTRVNVRAEPSMDATVVDIAESGTDVEVIAHDPAGWSRVQIGEESGYVRSDLLRMSVGDTPPIFRTTSGVNMRDAASTTANVVQTVERGTSVEVLEHNPEAWSRVRVGGAAGYIRSDFLTRSELDISLGVGIERVQATSAPALAQSSLYTTGTVNMRSGASTNDSAIRQLPPNTSVEILETQGDWSKVNYNGTSGFIRSDLLSVSGATDQVITLRTLTGVRMRSGPSTDYRILDNLVTNTSVDVLQNRADGWSQVRHGGNTGFIRSDLLGPETTFERINLSEARRVIPTRTDLRVTDVRTGISFNVRVMGVGNHADVDPVTQADTDALRRSRNGVWSWSARPVWITVGDRTFPASMNGMPHAGSSISGNGVSGHFCIWFDGSTSHTSTSSRYRQNMLAAVNEAWEARPR